MPEWHKQLLTYLYILSMYYKIKYCIILYRLQTGLLGVPNIDADMSQNITVPLCTKRLSHLLFLQNNFF